MTWSLIILLPTVVEECTAYPKERTGFITRWELLYSTFSLFQLSLENFVPSNFLGIFLLQILLVCGSKVRLGAIKIISAAIYSSLANKHSYWFKMITFVESTNQNA